MALIPTDCIDVFSSDGTLLMSLDGGNPREAAKQFAHEWRNGLIESTLNLKSGSPTMTAKELDALSDRAWLSECKFKRRYMDGTKNEYPEDGLGGKATSLAANVKSEIFDMSGEAWRRGLQHLDATVAETKKNLAVTDTKRYIEGLERVRQIDAANMLHDAIMGMSDEVGRAELINEFPELFYDDAMSALAQERSHEANVD